MWKDINEKISLCSAIFLGPIPLENQPHLIGNLSVSSFFMQTYWQIWMYLVPPFFHTDGKVLFKILHLASFT